MQPTRRFWQSTAIAALLAILAVLTSQPVLLLGSAAVATLLVARQWQFLDDSRTAIDTLSVDVEFARTYVRQNEETQVTFEATLTQPAPVEMTVSTPTPLASTGTDRLEVTIPAGEQQASTTTQLTWEIAGVATFSRPTVKFASRDGLFRQSVEYGPSPSVIVEPRAPRDIHVGEGGQRVDAAFGSHRTGEFGQGIDPAELREYVPGDDISDIDWKATARQNDLYVRQYEVETDRRTVLLFDHRDAMGIGTEDETMCTYLREVALAFTLAAEEFGDPLALYAVGNEGLTAEFSPGTEGEQYREIRQTLHDVEPTAPTGQSPQVAGPAIAGQKATALAGEDSAFATTLRPYFENTQEYVRQIEGEPLFDVARTYVQRVHGEAQTVIFTDDSDRVTLRETVKMARGGAGNVLVLITPRALFEDGSMADLEATYDRYAEFETFRRELAGIDRVDAYEVAPDERIEAVLRAGRESR